MSMNFKVSVFKPQNDEECLEARRFSMDTEDCNLSQFQEKLRNIFNNQSFEIFWKDSDGDKISIKSEDDFTACLEEQNQESVVKLILVKESRGYQSRRGAYDSLCNQRMNN